MDAQRGREVGRGVSARGSFKAVAALCVVVALLAGAAAATGVFLRGTGATETVTSVRGETYEMMTDGIYANNAERVVAEGIGWDFVTLLVAVPALLVAAPFVARGSLRGRLFALGVLSYFVYQYLMYAVFWALGPLFPLFVAIFPLAATALVWIASTIDVAGLPGRVGPRFPRRGMAVFSFLMALLLVGMWSQRIATGLSGDLEGAGLMGVTTLSVQALDLGVIVPLGVATGVLVLRRRPWGYVLSTVMAVKGASMALAICAMLTVAATIEGVVEWGPLAIFAAAAAASAVLGWRMFASLPSALDSPHDHRALHAR